MSGKLIVGTSGFSYAHWRDEFYPAGTPQSRWLEYYATVFSAVEMNVTFYRQPKGEQFSTWRERVPEDFRFVIKGSRFITHYRRLADVGDQLRSFFGAAEGLGGSLACVLWQLPPGMTADAERLRGFLEMLPRENAGGGALHHAFEFRDSSWFAESVYDMLREHGSALVLADPGAVGQPVPTKRSAVAPATAAVMMLADFVYLRFHGTEHDAGGYLESDLAPWVHVAAEALLADRDVYAFFNNDAWARAPRDGVRFRALVSQTAG